MLSTTEVHALQAAAVAVRQNAYAPHSGFAVGAALVTSDDRVFVGTNVENDSYGLSLCAERAAIAAAVAAGCRHIRALLVIGPGDQPVPPCGACRQWIAQFGSGSCEVLYGCVAGEVKRTTLAALLPEAFTLAREER